MYRSGEIGDCAYYTYMLVESYFPTEDWASDVAHRAFVTRPDGTMIQSIVMERFLKDRKRRAARAWIKLT